MNAILKPESEGRRFAPVNQVVSFSAGASYKGVKGYALHGVSGSVLGIIETLGPDKRLEELLSQYTAPPVYFTARELMRDLLNVEDYRSTVYDNIVRVHYAEDFANV
jgi:hypothetical protein